MTISHYSLGALLSALLAALAAPAAAQEFSAPSGLRLHLNDVVMEMEAGIARFRFVAPSIDPTGDAVPYEAVAGDFSWLCETLALPALLANEAVVGQVVISIADREVQFGAADAEATQFFESYVVDGETCVWEAF